MTTNPANIARKPSRTTRRGEALGKSFGIPAAARISVTERGSRDVRHEAVGRGAVPVLLAGLEFTDTQARGPYSLWEHTRVSEPDGEHACTIHDRVRYAIP
jgi:ligand-binding SRPBCC domain-containing protein